MSWATCRTAFTALVRACCLGGMVGGQEAVRGGWKVRDGQHAGLAARRHVRRLYAVRRRGPHRLLPAQGGPSERRGTRAHPASYPWPLPSHASACAGSGMKFPQALKWFFNACSLIKPLQIACIAKYDVKGVQCAIAVSMFFKTL